MKCNKCNIEYPEGTKICPSCGTFLTNINDENKVEVVKEKRKIEVNPFIIIIAILFIVLIILMIIYFKPKRNTILSKSNNDFSFRIEDDTFSINTKFKEYMDKGYYVEDSNSIVKYDTLSLNTLYKDEKPVALAAFYCPNKDGCKYEDSNVVKLNFYNNYKININDITKSTSYENVVKTLGKEDGVLTTDNSYKIWSKGKNIGDSYIMIRFSRSTIVEIRVGVWWYDGEYDHCVSTKGE